jgi:hypothetical protein
MNKLEKIIYDLVKGNPTLKFLFRNLYQSFFDLLPTEKNYFLNKPIVFKNSFYGFHDISPFHPNFNNIILSNRLTDEKLKIPDLGKELEVGYYHLANNVYSYRKLGVSKSWNFHKGCRLQWFNSDCLIYNSYEKGKLISILHNIQNNESQQFPYPIDSVCYGQGLVSTFSFERLEHFMPGYGYKGIKDNGCVENSIPSETGIKIIDYLTSQERAYISLKFISEKISSSKEEGVYHYVTHSSFSSDGRYVAFLHRQVKKQDLQKRISKLIIYNLSENSFFIPDTQGMVSHYVWNNKYEIVAYCNFENVDGHYLISVKTKQYRIIHPRVLNSDGHQSFLDDEHFVTDTYPNKRRISKIYLSSVSSSKYPKEIVRIFSPKLFQTKYFFNHIACDLHPRVSKDGSFLSFDGIIENQRCQIIMNIANYEQTN